MHRCLLVNDILLVIIEHLTQDESVRTSTFAALARTSKLFHGPALDSLWQSLPSLLPIIRCLPLDSLNIKSPFSTSPKIVLTRQLSASDWSECHKYTPRIKRLGDPMFLVSLNSRYRSIDNHRSENLKRFQVDALLLAEMEDALQFPNLQECYWDQLYTIPCRPFLNFNLTLLEFRESLFQDIFYDQSKFLCDLRDTCPQLKHLNITADCEPGATVFGDKLQPSDWEALVGGLYYLETLSCGRTLLPDNAIQTLAASSSLRTLRVLNDEAEFLRCLTVGASETPFAHIRNLEITAKDMDSYTEFLHLIASIQLNSLAINSSEYPYSCQLRNLFRAMAQHCSQDSFQSFYCGHNRNGAVFYEDEHTVNEDDYTINVSVIEPLLTFINLQVLSLQISGSFQFNNSDIELMASAWPRLKQFLLGHADNGWGKDSTATLEGLIPLATKCPDLETLHISMNAVSDNIASSVILSTTPRNFSLTMLAVGRSTLEDPECVARVLSHLFPSLTTVFCSYYSLDQQMRAKWDDVNFILSSSRMPLEL